MTGGSKVENFLKFILVVKRYPASAVLAVLLTITISYVTKKIEKLPEETAKVDAVKSEDLLGSMRFNLMLAMRESGASRAVVGTYNTSKDGDMTVEILTQVYKPGVDPIPTLKYPLYTNKLAERYDQHLRGECNIRAFPENSTVVAASCPLTDSTGRLLGYLSLNSVDPNANSKELVDYAQRYSPVLRPLLALYSKSQDSSKKDK